MSLPKPIGRQKEVLYLPAQGHVAVLGTAGSGKTTLAILRAAYLADPEASHCGKTLLVTFNRALVTYLKHLQSSNLNGVVVENYHRFARGYLNSRNRMSNNGILSPENREYLIEKAIEKVRVNHPSFPLLTRPKELFSEELRWISQHGITSLEEYREAERVGRANARIQRKDKDVVFEIYESYKALRTDAGRDYDWDDLASAVCEELDVDCTSRLYRHVVIDEGQDFSPEMIRSLSNAVPHNGSLTFFGDVAQQIYGHRISWRSAGLQIDKVWNFQENYRNSRQIARLGLAISKMPYFQGVADLVEPVAPSAEGPLPTLVRCSSPQAEIDLVVKQATQASRTLSVAILFRNREDEKQVVQYLPPNKVRLHKDLTTWRSGPGIFHGTYHSAKGLEFDMVILPFCSEDRLPDPELRSIFGEKDAMSQDGRLLYVGVTRAKTRLLISYCDSVTPLLPTDRTLYTETVYDP